LKKSFRLIKSIYLWIIIISIGCTIILPSSVTQEINIDTNVNHPSDEALSLQTSDDEYNFFSFAIIWGEFKTKEYPIPFIGLEVRNPYNNTMHVIGWVSYEHRFIYRNASFVYCPWWIGFVGSHRLFVIAWGHSVRVS
jgi:hypothetical protein